MGKLASDDPPPGYRWIFVKAYRHAKTGKLIRAEAFGLKAFRLKVRA